MSTTNHHTDISPAEEPVSEPEFHGLSEIQLQAWELLEFTNVRELLANRTRFFMSREMVIAARPVTDIKDVERLQDETAQAALMLGTVGDIGLVGTRDPRDLLRRAAIDGMLTGTEIVSVLHLLESIWTARNTVVAMKGCAPLLEVIVSEIPDLRDLGKEIFKSISEQGEVLNNATPKLARLRANVSKTFQRVMRAMERISNSKTVKQSLQSGAIATRGERLVLEVRADARDSVPGIVHDVSSSGATLFVEPLKAVELCNDWRETAAEAQREEERILRRLSRLIGDREEEAIIAVEAAAALDFITARARLAGTMKARRIETMPPGSDNVTNLVGARHPLLGSDAVPITINIGPGFRGLVITGPNTGGKTVAIKTIGLFALMHQSGLQLPVVDGEMAIFDAVYADIGDSQSIERSVSTFSSHMGRVIEILLEATPNSLILLDELGTGTDPEEGSALARAVLAHATENDMPIAVTSHYRAVAEYAAESEELANASVELNPDTMMPTYQVLMGIPGRSYALHVARHLGMPSQVLDDAESMMDPKRAEAETILQQLQREREEVSRIQAEAEEAKIEAETARKDLQSKLSNVTRAQEDMLEKSRMELRLETEEIRRSLRKIVSNAKNDNDLATAQRAIGRVRTQFSDPTWLPVAPPPDAVQPEQPEEEESLQPGDQVEIKGLAVEAEVIDVSPGGTVELMMGNSRIELNERQLRVIKPAPENKPAVSPNDLPNVTVNTVTAGETANTSGELDIRGSRVHESDEIVRQFIDDSSIQGLSNVLIIHGDGTGALRESIRVQLAKHPLVASYSAAPRNRGGNGATLVDLN
ncbi:MAG: Smr/MutS family protein [Dehalococcoidia bacterium]|jgi:DNA mismatch repair protein MutS2|nr:Smr/MutS family protein [Dehalococcoidia bacterium]MDP7090591.1 Smr/MutS family protein [Dehalococcoidia bacterium]MDP7261921.1 Smr/MutS family protein [Dehalococcoidia bacterium]MDP7485254.1 Smr/MutS family protein [Dehalococcoidia bacterium]